MWNSPICYFCLTCMLLILHSGCWHSFEKQRQGLETWIYLSTNKLSVKSLVYTDFNRERGREREIDHSWQDPLALFKGIFFLVFLTQKELGIIKDYLVLNVLLHEIIMNWQKVSDAINCCFSALCILMKRNNSGQNYLTLFWFRISDGFCNMATRCCLLV